MIAVKVGLIGDRHPSRRSAARVDEVLRLPAAAIRRPPARPCAPAPSEGAAAQPFLGAWGPRVLPFSDIRAWAMDCLGVFLGERASGGRADPDRASWVVMDPAAERRRELEARPFILPRLADFFGPEVADASVPSPGS